MVDREFWAAWQAVGDDTKIRLQLLLLVGALKLAAERGDLTERDVVNFLVSHGVSVYGRPGIGHVSVG